LRQPIPLSRFPLLTVRDVDEVTSTLNRKAGGERSCIGAARTDELYNFNFLRLGPVGIISQSMPASTIRYRDDSAGAFYFCLKNRLQMSQGRRSFEARAGQLMCVLPGADRTIHYAEHFSSFVVRIDETALSAAMRLLGHEHAMAWSSITTVLGQQAAPAQRYARLLREVVRLYDSQENFPDQRVDHIMGRSLASSAASMLSAMLPDQPRLDGPNFGVAEAAEGVIAERFASPLTASDIAEAVGQTLPCVTASLLLYTGLLPNELLTLVRLIAADEYAKRSYGDPELVAKACGFVTKGRYLAALSQRERLNGLLKRRARGRGFTP